MHSQFKKIFGFSYFQHVKNTESRSVPIFDEQEKLFHIFFSFFISIWIPFLNFNFSYQDYFKSMKIWIYCQSYLILNFLSFCSPLWNVLKKILKDHIKYKTTWKCLKPGIGISRNLTLNGSIGGQESNYFSWCQLLLLKSSWSEVCLMIIADSIKYFILDHE